MLAIDVLDDSLTGMMIEGSYLRYDNNSNNKEDNHVDDTDAVNISGDSDNNIIIPVKITEFDKNNKGKHINLTGSAFRDPAIINIIKTIPSRLRVSDQGRPPIEGIYATQTILHYAYTIWCEGRGEGALGMADIGSVIWNRVISNEFDNTVLGVVHALTPRTKLPQFSCWGDNGITQIRDIDIDYNEFLMAIDLAIGIYNNDVMPTTKALFYHADNIQPPVYTNALKKDMSRCGHTYYLLERIKNNT